VNRFETKNSVAPPAGGERLPFSGLFFCPKDQKKKLVSTENGVQGGFFDWLANVKFETQSGKTETQPRLMVFRLKIKPPAKLGLTISIGSLFREASRILFPPRASPGGKFREARSKKSATAPDFFFPNPGSRSGAAPGSTNRPVPVSGRPKRGRGPEKNPQTKNPAIPPRPGRGPPRPEAAVFGSTGMARTRPRLGPTRRSRRFGPPGLLSANDETGEDPS